MRQILELLLLFLIAACGDRTAKTNGSINDKLQVITTLGDSSLSQDTTDNFNKLLKSMLIGKWQQKTDKKQIIVIKKDSMIDIYNKKIISSDAILFAFGDSTYKYFVGNTTFNFDNPIETDLFEIQIISQGAKDTMNNIIMHVDSNNLEFGYNQGIVSFKRIN